MIAAVKAAESRDSIAIGRRPSFGYIPAAHAVER